MIHRHAPRDRPFRTLYEQPSHQGHVSTFERVRTTGDISQRLTIIARTMGYSLEEDYENRLRTLWGLHCEMNESLLQYPTALDTSSTGNALNLLRSSPILQRWNGNLTSTPDPALNNLDLTFLDD